MDQDYRFRDGVYPSVYIAERRGRHRYGPWYRGGLNHSRRDRYISIGRVLLMKGKRYLVYRMSGDRAGLPHIFFEGHAHVIYEQ